MQLYTRLALPVLFWLAVGLFHSCVQAYNGDASTTDVMLPAFVYAVASTIAYSCLDYAHKRWKGGDSREQLFFICYFAVPAVVTLGMWSAGLYFHVTEDRFPPGIVSVFIKLSMACFVLGAVEFFGNILTSRD